MAAHLLEQCELASQRGFVDGGTERAEVVVVAYSAELPALAVEEEALVGHELYGAYTEACHVFVNLAPVLDQRGHGIVEGRAFGTPQRGISDREVLFEAGGASLGPVGKRDCPALGVADLGAYPVGSVGRDLDVHRGLFPAHGGRGHLRAPDRHVHLVSHNHMDVPVQTRSGIPARGFREIVEPHCQHVVAPVGIHVFGNVIVEGHIAVGPVADELSVEVDLRAAHRAVEEYLDAFPGRIVRDVEAYPVPACSGVGETSGASGLEGGLRLVVLCYRHDLGVVAGVEGAVNGPVVGNGDVLPAAVVEVAAAEISVGASESPAFLKQEFLPRALSECERRREQQRHDA